MKCFPCQYLKRKRETASFLFVTIEEQGGVNEKLLHSPQQPKRRKILEMAPHTMPYMSLNSLNVAISRFYMMCCVVWWLVLHLQQLSSPWLGRFPTYDLFNFIFFSKPVCLKVTYITNHLKRAASVLNHCFVTSDITVFHDISVINITCYL